MKANSSFFMVTVVLVSLVIVSLSSCTMDGPDCPASNKDVVEMNLGASVHADSEFLLSVACTENEPCRIYVFESDEFEPFHYAYEGNAFVSEDTEVRWLDSPNHRYGKVNWLATPKWSNHQSVKYVGVWPADATIEFDKEGNVLYTDAVLLAESGSLKNYGRGTFYIHFELVSTIE